MNDLENDLADGTGDAEWFEQKLVAVVVLLNDLMAEEDFQMRYEMKLVGGQLSLTKDLA